jgi:hypothetical protein
MMTTLKTTKTVLTVGLTRLLVEKTLSALRGTRIIPEGSKVKIVRRTIRADGVRAEVFVALLVKAAIERDDDGRDAGIRADEDRLTARFNQNYME